MGYAATNWQKEIVTSLNYLKKQIECIQRRGCLCFGHPTDLVFDKDTSRLTARFVDDSEHTVELDIPRSLSHLHFDKDIKANIDTVYRAGKWYYAITITDLNGNAHVLEFEKIENTSQLRNDGENGSDKFFSNANWKFHSHVVGKVDKSGAVSMETDSPIATIEHDGKVSEIKESLTTIRMNDKNMYLLEYIDENGKLTQLDLSWLILDASYDDTATPKHKIGHLTIASMAQKTGRAKMLVDTDINETVTTLQQDADKSVLLYKNEAGVLHRIPLADGLGITALYVPSKRPNKTNRIGSLTIIQNGKKVLDDTPIEETVTSLRIDPGAKDLEYFDENGVMNNVPLDFLTVHATFKEPSSSTHPIATIDIVQGDDEVLHRDIKETVTSLTRSLTKDMLLFKDETGHINEIPLVSVFSVANLQYVDVTKGKKNKIGNILYESAKGPVKFDVFETISELKISSDGKTLTLVNGDGSTNVIDLTKSVKSIMKTEDIIIKSAVPFIEDEKVKLPNADKHADAKPFELGYINPLNNVVPEVTVGHTIATIDKGTLIQSPYGSDGASNLLISSERVPIKETVTKLESINRDVNPYLQFTDEQGKSSEINYPTFISNVYKEGENLVIRKSDGNENKINIIPNITFVSDIKKNDAIIKTQNVESVYNMEYFSKKGMSKANYKWDGSIKFNVFSLPRKGLVEIMVSVIAIDFPYNLLFEGSRSKNKIADPKVDSLDVKNKSHDINNIINGFGKTAVNISNMFTEVSVPIRGNGCAYYVEWLSDRDIPNMSFGSIDSVRMEYTLYYNDILIKSEFFTIYNV